MAATFVDLSRRGDLANALPLLAAELDGQLASWIAAANAQNPSQLLTLSTNSQQAPGYLGWTLRASLLSQQAAAPVVLMSQWVIHTTTAAITTHVGLASGHNPAGGLGAHGLLSGGRGSTNSSITTSRPLPLAALAAWSLSPGGEFFVFSLCQHTFSNRQSLPLLIAKDVISGNWHLGNIDMAGVINTAAWSVNKPQLLLSDGFRNEQLSSGLPLLLSRPAQWQPLVPGAAYVEPLPPVQWWDPVALPADLAIYNRTYAHMGYFKAADGSEWLQLGPSRLVVRVVDPAAAI
ncbi:MAG: hypothetical protein R6W06_02785 [Prochlorococcaceae cyanobacterium]